MSGVSGPWATDPPFFERALDAVTAYAATLGRLLWPADLSIVYPTPTQMGLPRVGVGQVGLVFALGTATTVFAAARGARQGYLLVGCLWFIGMLFPMVGLIPSGLRVMHDRYAYLPMIGIAIAVSFAAADSSLHARLRRAFTCGAAIALLAVYAGLSWKQVSIWRDTLVWFDHALEVTERNAIVHFYKGNTLASRGKFDAASTEFEAALAIHPPYPRANNALGYLYLQTERPDRALPLFRRTLALRPTGRMHG